MKPTWGIHFVDERFEGDQLVVRLRFSRLRIITEIARGMRDGARGKPLLVQLRIAAFLVAVVGRLMLRPLAAVAGVALLALGLLLLTGCAGGQTPRLSPIAPRVLVRPEYGTCVETGGKIEIPQAGTIAMLTSACFASMDARASAPDASEPEPAVIPDKSDAGASE